MWQLAGFIQNRGQKTDILAMAGRTITGCDPIGVYMRQVQSP